MSLLPVARASVLRVTPTRAIALWIAQSFRHEPESDSVMGTQIETAHVRRTLRDKLLLWRRAFETKIFDERREAIGRGPTVEASRDAALAVWVTDGQREFEADRDTRSVAR